MGKIWGVYCEDLGKMDVVIIALDCIVETKWLFYHETWIYCGVYWQYTCLLQVRFLLEHHSIDQHSVLIETISRYVFSNGKKKFCQLLHHHMFNVMMIARL